jgi:hypothetical protein
VTQCNIAILGEIATALAMSGSKAALTGSATPDRQLHSEGQSAQMH